MQALSLQQSRKVIGPSVLFALILMVQMQLWDGVITQVLVSNGIARELNPLVMSSISQGSFLPLKIAGLVVCVAMLWLISKRFPRLATMTASTIAVFYAVVLSWNFITLFTA